MLSKALREFNSGPLHQLLVNLGGKDATEWEAEFKKFLRKEPCWVPSLDLGDLISRKVSVNRNRAPMEALRAAGVTTVFAKSGGDVVTKMPRGEGEEAEVFFFKLKHVANDFTDLMKEYRLRGLKPADPYSLAAVNEADPMFASEYPNVTHWRKSKCYGEWCIAMFGRFLGEDRTAVRPNWDSTWSPHWWHAGLHT